MARASFDQQLWLQWGFATMAGLFLGGLVGLVVGFLPGRILDGLLGGMAGGSVLGAAQWFVLRFYMARAYRWIAATAGAGAIAGVMLERMLLNIGVTHNFVDGLEGWVLIGMALGLTQWFVLRKRTAKASWWFTASVVGWTLAGIIGAIAGMMVHDTVSAIAGGIQGLVWGSLLGVPSYLLVAGAIDGILTGRALIWILRQPRPSRPNL